jgi:MFS transporter, ACS family, hexuronate transporter
MSNEDSTTDRQAWKQAANSSASRLFMAPLPTSDVQASMDGTTPMSEASPSAVGHFRWVICTLLLLGVTKNYMDRQVLGVLKTTLQHTFGWNEIDYGNLVFAFQTAYAMGMIVVGRLIDRLGTRLGYALAMGFWSLAAMGHAAASSLSGFAAARSGLGFGEAGVFPASIKSVAEWFPRKEQSLAIGIFNAGSNVGAILTPLVVPWITIRWGWRWAFLITGAVGFVWLILWAVFYRKPEQHPRLTKGELEYICSDRFAPVARIGWITLISYRQAWAFVAGKFFIDPIWWFYLFWVPDFLQRRHGLALMQIGLPLVVIYLIADVGSVSGGWFSSWLIRSGKSINFARKSTMLLCAMCILPIVLAYRIESLWGAVLVIGLAAGGHQGFSANLFALTSDTFPSQAVGSVVGMGGMAGAIGGMLIAKIVGYTLQWTGSYMIPFCIAGSAYFVALACIHMLSPKLQPVELRQN